MMADIIPFRGASPSTVEALMYELRESGLDAVKAPNCRRRLGELSREQIKEVLTRLIKRRPRHPKITDELLLRIEDLRK
jgi:transposase